MEKEKTTNERSCVTKQTACGETEETNVNSLHCDDDNDDDERQKNLENDQKDWRHRGRRQWRE